MTPPNSSTHLAIDAPEALAQAATALRRSEPIVVPTDTVYGLAAIAADADGVDALFELKNRPADRSIAVLVADADQLDELVLVSEIERKLMDAHWPGGLTLVLRRRPDVTGIGSEDGTVGVRCPNETFVRDLAAEVGPLATTSANLSGQPTPAEASDASESLTGPVAVVIDGGTRSGAASTVARVVVGANGASSVEVLRPGPISVEELQEVAGL